MNAKIVNAEFSLFDSFLLQKVNGSVLLAKDHLVGQNFSLSINGMPFVADFAFFNKGQPHLLLQLFSQEKTAVFPAFVLNLSGDWINNELNVDAKSRLHFGSKGTKSVLDIGFKNLRLGFEDNLFFDAQALDAGLTVTSVDARKEEKIFDRKVTLEHPYSVLRREEDGFVLDNIEATCYDGALEGQTRFIYKNDHLDVKGEAHLKDVDLKKFFQESRVNEYTLSGKLTGDFRFDTTLVDMIKGQIFINDGLIEQNPLLNTVSNFLGVASLKKINFDDLTMFFSGGRGDYASQVKLQSPQVTALLDGRVSGYDKMDGFLTISLSTQLLNESKQFKKILTYIKHDEPSVIFPFKIFSYINSPRVLWLKNEFKVKLQNLIPESNKRFLQRQVNGMVEKIDGE
jgi:hypothetical protein